MVRVDATVPLMSPPATVPMPGMSLNRFPTMAFPMSVAVPVPAMADMIVWKRALEFGKPKILVIFAIRVICMPDKTMASENGIGVKPTPNELATNPIDHFFASLTFRLMSLFCALTNAFLVASGRT